MKLSRLTFSILFWRRLLKQLKARGGGERESGGFLLGKPGSSRATHFLCYDDLDSKALEMGIITFHSTGFVKLWDFCQQENLKVLADVHTHPSAWTDQSESDRTHPMVAAVGHIALIVPHFAQRIRCSFSGVGIYEYLGDHNWKKWSPKSGRLKVTLL